MIQPSIEPDTKDWTWVLREPCPECGFVAADARPRRPRSAGPRRRRGLGRGAGASPARPSDPTSRTWSPLEYACHVRDVHRIFGERLGADARRRTSRPSPTGTRTRPRSPSATTSQDPAVVGPELRRRPTAVAAAVRRARRRLRGDLGPARAAATTAASSPSTRSRATTCTTCSTTATTSARAAARATVAAYDGDADAVQRGTWAAQRRDAGRAGLVRRRRSARGSGARDRQRRRPRRRSRSRSAGCTVRRTDVTPGVRRAAARAGATTPTCSTR